MSPKTTKPKPNLRALAHWVADEAALFDPDGPFEADVADGDPHLLVITGENASGKSLFFRILSAKAQQAGALPITLSIRERSGSGTGEMSRIRQVFMFGDEHEQSTGATSVKSIRSAFESNLDRPEGSVLGLDEPELGLSDGYADALGTYIGRMTKQIPRPCAGVVVVTHSRTLVRALVDAFGSTPTHVALGREAGIARWLDEPEARTVEDLLNLAEIGQQRWRWAADMLRDSR